MKPVIDQKIGQGFLKQVLSSSCNSPVMGIKKPSGNWRTVQDLHRMNTNVVPGCPVVPNPAVILFQIPKEGEWFTVTDLCQAFFSIPLHEDSQYLFGSHFKIRSTCGVEFHKGILNQPQSSIRA